MRKQLCFYSNNNKNLCSNSRCSKRKISNHQKLLKCQEVKKGIHRCQISNNKKQTHNHFKANSSNSNLSIKIVIMKMKWILIWLNNSIN